jgi:hypothetical protein
MAMELRNVESFTPVSEPDRMKTSGAFGNLENITNFTVKVLTEAENTLD